MKQKDNMQPSILKQNKFFQNQIEEDITEYRLTKPQKISILDSNKTVNNQKKKKRGQKIQSFMNKVNNETVAIKIQFDQQEIEENSHLQSEIIKVSTSNESDSFENACIDAEIQQKSQIQRKTQKYQPDSHKINVQKQDPSQEISKKKSINFCLSLADDSDCSDDEKENSLPNENSNEPAKKRKFTKINYLSKQSNKNSVPNEVSKSPSQSIEIQHCQSQILDQNFQLESIKEKKKAQQIETKKKPVLLINFDDNSSEQSQEEQEGQINLQISASQKIPKHAARQQDLPKPKTLQSKKSKQQNNVLLCNFGEQQTSESSQSLGNSNPVILKTSSFDSSKSISSNDEQITLRRTISIVQLVRMSPTSAYVYEPIPQNCIFQSIVKRYQQSNENNLVFEMFDHDTYKSILKVRQVSEGFEIFSAKESLGIVWNGNSRSLPKVNEETSCALLCSNFFGTQFNCFKFNRNNEKPDSSKLNRQITIDYETKLFGFNGPRKMHVYIPSTNYLVRGEKNLKEAYQSQKQLNSKEAKKIEHFVNRKPKWNSEISSFVLNFNGRATLSSVKNFIITRQMGEGKNIMNTSENLVLFGKMEKNVFNLDIKYPFNLIQGLALALSSFDKKIGSQ